MDSRKRPPEAPFSRAARPPRSRLRVRVPAALRTSSPAPPHALGLRPGLPPFPGPGVPREARLAVGRKSFLDEGRRVLLTQGRRGFCSSRAGAAQLGQRNRGGRNRVARGLALQLLSGTVGPAPAAPPPPPPTEPLPAAAATAAAGPVCTLGSGTLGSRSFLRAGVRSPTSPAPRRPYLSPPGPGLRREAQGAGGGGSAGRRKRRAGRKRPSPERSPLQLQPRAPSLFPAPQTRRRQRQRRKEAPVFQRHLALQHRPPRARGDSGGAAAAGSIGACSPGAEQAADPAPSRRTEMRGRAPRRPITVRRPPGPPRACLPVSQR
ncbi:uncharacterized protein LOC101028331 [Saimiri boliviensis]|uniref:uncharacterized protein LOC101028331 n=1 Tax=Saimiri boliviensis TaxID=27679 RepID=UPI00193D2A0A|nr:translation initiation factor IF-2-like [Saimiri boliviensis boliviensis]